MRIKTCSLIFSSVADPGRFLSLDQDLPPFLRCFGGRFSYLDFYLSTLHHAGTRQHLLITQRYAEETHNYMENTWGEAGWKILPFIPEEGDKPFDKQMAAVLKQELATWVFLIQADHPCYFDAREITERVSRRHKILVPTIKNKALPCLVVERGVLLDTLGELQKKNIPASAILGASFQVLSKARKAHQVEIHGYYHPINNLDSYISANLEVLKRRDFFDRMFEKVPLQSGIGEKEQAVIAEGGEFYDSMISDSCHVRGTVIRSILFPGVRVGKNARVVDSIVLPGIVVGNGASVVRCLIDRGPDLPQNVRSHIGDNAKVGKETATRANEPHGELLSRGYTYVAGGALIPRGVSIGANCYIGPGVNRNNFKRTKNVSDGRSLTPVRAK